jgi:hypothetical protein
MSVIFPAKGRFAADEVQPPVVCASWCRDGDGHPGERQRDNQVCYSEEVVIPLSVMPQVENWGSYEPAELMLCAEPDPEWQRTAIAVAVNGTPDHV